MRPMRRSPPPVPALVTDADLALEYGLSVAELTPILENAEVWPTARASHIGVYDRASLDRARQAVEAELTRRKEVPDV